MVTGKLDSTLRLFGLSTDTKPTDVGNGSSFFEMNTGDTYYFKDNYWVTSDDTATDEYDENKQYFPGDLVLVDDPAYACKNACKNVSPATSTNVGIGWILPS